MIHDEDVKPTQLYAWHVNISYHLCKQVERAIAVTNETKRGFTERAIRALLTMEDTEH